MKTFLSIVICFTVCFFSSIQISAQWDLTGNAVGPGEYLGSTNAQDLRFRTNNLNRMRILQSNGYVGIGNYTQFSPLSLLHANGLSFTPPNGNQFRTDGNHNQILVWSMFSGTTVANSTQKARFFLSPNTLTQNNNWGTGMVNVSRNHVVTESTLGDVIIQAAGAGDGANPGTLTERLRITSALYLDPTLSVNPLSTTRVGISGRPGTTITEPLAILHIGDRWTNQVGGHRAWMSSGSYIQRVSDNAYFGMRPRENATGNDQNDAIIAWGDNDTPVNRLDALRFVFCAPFAAGANPGQATHLNGLETMRIHPGGNIGMGDFSFNGLDQTPTEKLDLDGRLRIRDVPLNPSPPVLIVGRQIDTIGDYLINHLPFSGNGNTFLNGNAQWTTLTGEDCRWIDANSTTVVNEIDIITGFPQDEDCDRGKVGIGVDEVRSAKLEVENIITRDEINTAIYGRTDMDGQMGAYPDIYFGVYGETVNGGIGNYASVCGVKGYADNSRYLVGVFGEANPTIEFSNGHSMGVAGLAHYIPGNLPIGVYGEVFGQVANTAGYFVGGITTTGGPLIISDESVKTDVQDLLEATSILSQLEPKTYSFVSPDNREIPFDQGTRFGFIAQELQNVLPELVEGTTIPERIDSTGFVEGTSVELLGIKYTELIPILVAGFKEQNTVIAEQASALNNQNDIIADLQAMVSAQATQMELLQNQTEDLLESIQSMQQKTNNCCQDKNGVNDEGFIPSQVPSSPMELGQNIPNPFSQSTRIDFSLPQDAQVILEISDAQGRPIRKLIDGQVSAGQHTTTFDGSSLASGVYYYTLYADGQLLTKRMMKL